MTPRSSESAGFNALVSKEIRANAGWMMLGFSWTLVLLVLSVLSVEREWPSVVQILSVYPASTVPMGLILGITSMLSESRGDSLGFLLHRPLSRNTIFAGKVTGALICYLAAVVLPLLIILIWSTKMPVPFDVLELRGPLVDVLCGAVFFFAAFMSTVRDARWWATRWLAIGAALLTLAETISPVDFPWALFVTLAALVVAAVSAWGTFIAAGGFERQPLTGRFATALSVGVAILGISIMTVGVAIHTISYRLRERHEAIQQPEIRLEVATAGPLRTVRLGGDVREVTDMSGKPVDPRILEMADDSVQSMSIRTTATTATPSFFTGFRNSDDIYATLESANSTRGTDWYFLRRSGLILGYNRLSGKLSARVSPSGFSDSVAVPGSAFEGPLLNSMPYPMAPGRTNIAQMLVFPGAVYSVNFRKRTMETLYTAKAGETIADAEWGALRGNLTLLIATSEALYFRDANGKMITIRHPAPDVIHATLYRVLTTDSSGWYVRYKYAIPKEPRADEVIKLSTAGEPIDRFSIPLAPLPPRSFVNPNSESALVLIPPVLHLPELLSIEPGIRGHFILMLTDAYSQATDAYERPLLHNNWYFRVVGILALLSCISMTVLAVRHSFALNRTLAWAIAGLLLGPIGVALMFALVEWPAREKCPGCGRQRIVTRERCEHCDKEFAPPEPDGTEIFEPSYS